MGVESLVNWWMPPQLWESEQRDVRSLFPDAYWMDIQVGTRFKRKWEMAMAPMPPADELEAVLADLAEGTVVDISLHGQVRHSQSCAKAPADHRFELSIDGLAPTLFKTSLV